MVIVLYSRSHIHDTFFGPEMLQSQRMQRLKQWFKSDQKSCSASVDIVFRIADLRIETCKSGGGLIVSSWVSIEGIFWEISRNYSLKLTVSPLARCKTNHPGGCVLVGGIWHILLSWHSSHQGFQSRARPLFGGAWACMHLPHQNSLHVEPTAHCRSALKPLDEWMISCAK